MYDVSYRYTRQTVVMGISFSSEAEGKEDTQSVKEKGDKSVGSNTNGHRRYRLL